MPIVYRRVFYAKPLAANELVETLKEVFRTLDDLELPATNPRILTDYQSGRRDRVVEEFEIAHGELEHAHVRLLDHPAAREAMMSFRQRIFSLVDYSEVEHWTIR